MDDPNRFSIELPEDLANEVRARVASGRFESESDVIQEGLRMLAEQDEPLEPWLEANLAAGYDAWKANPTGGLTLDEVRARLDEERARRQASA